MHKMPLALETMQEEAKEFCHEESSFANPDLFGEQPLGNVAVKDDTIKTSWDYLLYALLAFLLLMCLANLTMAAVSIIAIPNKIVSRHHPSGSNVQHVIYFSKGTFFGMSTAFTFFLFGLGWQRSYLLFHALRKGSLVLLLGNTAESVDYWTHEENVVLGRKISHAWSNLFLCMVSLYFTVIVFRHFYANLPTIPNSGKVMYSTIDGFFFCYIAATLFVCYCVTLNKEKKRTRKQRKIGITKIIEKN